MVNVEELRARILYRDAMMLVIDKPAGLAVHAGNRSDHHLGQYLASLSFGLPNPPELAHRLDRDTSGCLILGRHRQALRRLGALFAHGRIEKVYWAVVMGGPPGDAGVIDKPLAKIGPAWRWKVKVDESGQPSVTAWRCMGRGSGLAWIECRPKSGRTHQLRVHLASIGCPILGDRTYGRTADGEPQRPLHLHARAVTIPLYPNKPAVSVEAPVPDHMRAALRACGWPGESARVSQAVAG
jgi:tRNA pseudouridine32 synthase/23S rRNA pseudouridine746 synthase